LGLSQSRFRTHSEHLSSNSGSSCLFNTSLLGRMRLPARNFGLAWYETVPSQYKWWSLRAKKLTTESAGSKQEAVTTCKVWVICRFRKSTEIIQKIRELLLKGQVDFTISANEANFSILIQPDLLNKWRARIFNRKLPYKIHSPGLGVRKTEGSS